MSTTFGIEIKTENTQDENVIEVAFRTRTIHFTNPLAHLLPDDTKVIALDNTAQGIETIGDIKKEIQEQNKKNKKV